MKPQILSMLLGAQLAILTTASAQTQTFAFADNDVLLGFMASDGTGSSDDVFVNLGSSINLRNNGNLGVVGNIGATLANTYGDDWFTREDVRFGVFANRDQRRNDGIGAGPSVDGDPSRTVYVSRATSVPGGAAAWADYVPDGLGSAAGAFAGTKDVIRKLARRGDGSARMRVSELLNPNEFNNGWSAFNKPTPEPGFIVFSGGIVNNFKDADGEVFVDIQRILSTNTGASPTQPVLGTGVYVATVGISSNGAIRVFNASVPSTPPIPAFVDSDGDGLSDFLEDRLVEYGFDKNVAQPVLVAQFLQSQGFFTESSIQDLSANSIIVQKSGTTATLNIPVERSTNLVPPFTPAGNAVLQLQDVPADKEFYRFRVAP